MSLRMRLFLLFGGLIALLLSAQWYMWRSMSSKLNQELDNVAFSVGRDVATLFSNGSAPFPIEHSLAEVKAKGTPGSWQVRQEKGDEDGEHEELDESESKHKSFSYRFVIKDGKTEFSHSIEAESSEQVDTSKPVESPPDPNQKPKTSENKDETTFSVVSSNNDQPITFVRDLGDSELVQVIKTKEVHKLKTSKGDQKPLRTLLLSVDNDDLVFAEDSASKRIPIPKTGISERLVVAQQRYLIGSMGILILGLFFAGLAAHRFSQPLRRLAAVASEVGQGNLGLQVTDQAGGEVGIAIGAFNKMSLHLKELDDSARALQQRQYLSELGEIANGLAHTIRNPLNTLGLSLEQLAALSSERAESQELAQLGRHQIRRIDQWIRSFLVLASQGVAREEPINFRRIIEDVVLEAIQDGSKNVDLELDLPEEIPDIAGVAPEMRAVIQALVVNAVEATPENGLVHLSLSVSESEIVIEIRDRGPGLDPAVRDKLFTPHVTTKETGSGMGLFLAHRIISSRYQGTVSLEPAEGIGTIARVSLPRQEQNHD